MRSHCRCWFSLSRPEAASSSAFRQGATSATQAAKAFWLILTKSSASFGFFCQVGAVDDQRIAVGVEADVLPVDKAEVGAELDHLEIVLVVEIADDIDGVALQRRDLGGRADIDETDGVGRDPRGLGEGRPHHPRGVAGRVADLVARKILGAVHAVALQPVEGLPGIGIDAHQRHDVGALALRHQHGGEIGDAERRAAGADLQRRDAGALADLDGEVDAGLLVPALRLGVIERRMVRGRRPVQDQVDGLAGAGGNRRRQQRERQSRNPQTLHGNSPRLRLRPDGLVVARR